jgi:hypothetical protein
MVERELEPKMEKDFLLTTCVHRFAICASHNDFSMGSYTLLGFLISFPHHIGNALLSLVNLWQMTTFSS